jgi:cyclopropane fatty-acyl-phospholipid synthase-like methyltransferase
MGEPAVPSEDARREALELAERVLDAIRNDQPLLDVICTSGGAATLAAAERNVWLLAATLVYYGTMRR